MATPPDTKSANQILRNFRARMEERTGITNYDSDTKMGALIDVVIDEVVESRNQSIQAYYNQQLTRAKGQFLDRIGQNLGLPRFEATKGSSVVSEQNVAFYVDSGVFGDINGGGSFVVPAGTVIYSNSNQNELGTVVEYETTADVTCPAAGAIAYASVRAKISGSAYNVGEGVLQNHLFTGYSLSASNGLKVINFYSILSGQNREADESYRFRLSKNYDRLVSSNNTKLKLTAVSVPGVIDVKVIRNYFGIGTAGAIVLCADFTSSSAILNAVQNNLDQLSGPGLKVVAAAATKVSIDLEIQVEPTRQLTTAEKRNAESAIKAAATNYLRSVGISGTMNVSDLADAIRRNTTALFKIGRTSDNSFKAFSKIYVRRGYASGFSSEKELLIGNSLVLEQEEFADLGTLSISYRTE